MKIEPANFTMGYGVECPDCHGINTYKYNSDTTSFANNGIGVVNTSHHCEDCDKSFRLHTNFTYSITEQQTGY